MSSIELFDDIPNEQNEKIKYIINSIFKQNILKNMIMLYNFLKKENKEKIKDIIEFENKMYKIYIYQIEFKIVDESINKK